MLQSEWGYVVTLRRDDVADRRLVEAMLHNKGLDRNNAILVIPPRQLISVDFNPRGEVDGSSQLDPDESSPEVSLDDVSLHDKVRASAAKRILFLPHAVSQMSRPDA